jgi:UTP--glucose-1-phosphate uridylyltransferase
MFGDDILVDDARLLKEMIQLSAGQHTVLALREVPQSQISAYGCADFYHKDGRVLINGVVEKPTSEDAPSNMAVIGRYVFTPEIFPLIERVPTGRNGEVPLTSAIMMLCESDQDVLGCFCKGDHFDVGNKLEYMKTSVLLALRHPEIKNDFRDFLDRL